MKKNLLKLSVSLVLIALTSLTLSIATGGPIVAFAIGLFALGFIKGLIVSKFEMPKNLAYDGFVISDTTYAGEAASNFIVKAITSNETVEGGHVYVKDGIKKKFTIPRWDADYNDFVQDRAATPIGKGTMTTDGKVLTPADYMIYTEFNPRDYEAHWYATQLNTNLIDRALPATVESVVTQEVLKRHNRYLNKALWNNNTLAASTSTYRYYDGFIRKAFAASSGTDVTAAVSSPTTLTITNIVTELQRGYDLIPAALKYDASMKVFCSYATYDLFMQYQIAQANKGVDITNMGVPTFRGLPMIKIADFPANTFIMARGMATPESNLWVGMNSVDDAMLEVKPLQANSELWFIKMLMKVDVQIGWNSETVYYGPTPSTTP
jgi:hypothetical protein